MKLKFAFTSLFFLVFCVGAYGIQVSMPEISAAPGAVITVGISVDDATGIAGGDIELEYDPAILEVKDARSTDLVKPLGNPLINTTVAGKVKIAMAAISGLAGGSGAMFELDCHLGYRILQNAAEIISSRLRDTRIQMLSLVPQE